MKTENFSAVLKHINKDNVELSSEKVELGLVQDLKKETSTIKEIRKEVIETVNEYKALKKRGQSLNKYAANKLADLLRLSSEYEKASKELGMKPESNNVFTDARDAYTEIRTYLEQLEKLSK